MSMSEDGFHGVSVFLRRFFFQLERFMFEV